MLWDVVSYCEFNYDYIQGKCSEKARLCFVLLVKTEDSFKDIKIDGEKRYCTSDHVFDQPLPSGKGE